MFSHAWQFHQNINAFNQCPSQIFKHPFTTMDGFALAHHIMLCAEDTILYSDIPSTLIGPYFPEESLSITQFLRFNLPILKTSLHGSAANISHHPPSINELSECDLCGMHCPPHSVIKKLISEYDPDIHNPSHSVNIDSRYVPINIL
jgi:hypothetical protein